MMMLNVTRADIPTSTEPMVELITPLLDRNKDVSKPVPKTCPIMSLKSILIETQTCSTHSEELESSLSMMPEITSLISARRRREMSNQRLGMSHGSAVILLRLHASAKVLFILVLLMLTTLVIDSIPLISSELGNISQRRLMTGWIAL